MEYFSTVHSNVYSFKALPIILNLHILYGVYKQINVFFLLGSHDKAMYLELAHGGHLGFYEGGLIYANPVNWLDRALVGLAGGLLMTHNKCSYKDAAVVCDYAISDDEPDLIKSSTIVYHDPLEKKIQ